MSDFKTGTPDGEPLLNNAPTKAIKRFRFNEALEEDLATANVKIAALQAKIDSLMLEYCPDEMTKEQLINWGKHQNPVEYKPWLKITLPE